MASSRGLDENRLHQEAILLAAKADIREELDRLKTHVAAARALIDEGGPIGRRLDFLAQELAREASTLCAKANDVSLTAQGLELRAQIEQFREQVQNVDEIRSDGGEPARHDPDSVLALGGRQDHADPDADAGQALDLTLSVSVTTRPRRSSEVDGIHYRFIDRREFERMKKAGDLLEWAEVHGNGYGTPREPVEKVLAQGRDMLFDVDWQGAQQVRERLGDDVVSIFVLPPSMRELRARLERRAEDSAASIESAARERAKQEIERWRNYHYVIVNDDLSAPIAT